MPVSQENFNKNLYDLLHTQGYKPVSLDSKGKVATVPNEADVFKISLDDDTKNAYVTIDDAQQLKIYTNDQELDGDSDTSSLNLLNRHLKKWAQRRQLGFEIVNRDHLQPDMAMREHMKQKTKLGEGYYPMGKNKSYSDNVPQVKIVLQHTRQIEEGEQRFRNIAKIFVENINGERFLLPTNRPGIARVYARHIAEGGTPYDDKGLHITSLVEEYTKMAGFVRATKNGQFNESTQRLVTEGFNHYQNLRETLSRMTSRRGYNNYFENYTPVLNEETDDATSLTELFVQEKLDPRIESVLPILNRLSKNITEMNVVKELEEWATTITEVEDETTKTLAVPAADMLDEAPGAETLAHDDETEKSNLKAFDLEEEISVKYEVIDKDGKRIGTWDGMVFMPYDKTKFPSGKMDKIPNNSKVDKAAGPVDYKRSSLGKIGMEEEMVAGKTPDELKRLRDIPTTQRIKSGETELDRTNYNLPTDQRSTTAGKPGYEIRKEKLKQMGAEEVNEAEKVYYHLVVDGVSKGKFKDLAKANEMISAMKKEFPNKDIKVEKKNEFAEDLDANQKRAGQLGPTEPVGKNEKNLRGKLVGANEGIELDAIKRLSGIK